MAVSMREVDPVFQGVGQKTGLEIWRIENFRPVSVPPPSHGNFFTGDSYVILKTTALKSGAFRHDIHYWIGKDTSQDEASTAAIKTVELDAALGGRAVQYREIQGYETEKFLSYFKPCIIPQSGSVASGFKHAEENELEYETRLYVCRGKHVVYVKEVPFVRTSLSHDDIFILDTKHKVFQFNGCNTSIQERAKALEVVQYIKDTYHGGKCDVATVEDGKLMADLEAGEFWGFFGGFAPLPRKAVMDEKALNVFPTKLIRVDKGQSVIIQADSLTRELLDTNKCFVLDCGIEIFVWMGRSTPLEDRKKASSVAEELLRAPDRQKANITRVIEGFETVGFRLKFDSWPVISSESVAVSEDSRGRVAAALKRQGFNVKGMVKAAPVKEEIQPHIDCTGNLQVWRVDGEDKKPLQASEQSKFYTGDCYIFQYAYTGEGKEEILIGTWFGQKSIKEERSAAILLATKMAESLKFQAAQARIYEGKEPPQFFAIFQSFIVYKGGVSSGYKNYISEKGSVDDTYSENGIALFRVQGSGPENMQAIQVEPLAASLNSSYCFILHSGDTVLTWIGGLATSGDQELVERQLDLIKPNLQAKPQKEGNESEQFWKLLGGKHDYRSQKVSKHVESDPHLFSCSFIKGNLKVAEIFNFTQDDLMTEEIFVLDCYSDIFVWIGQQVDSNSRVQALNIADKFLEYDFLLEKLSREAPIFIIFEDNEPPFFTRFFKWDNSKSGMHGNSFQRKLSIIKYGVPPTIDKPKRRPLAAYGGRTGVPADKSQRSRSMSFSPERVRVIRGRSPAFNALAANFENLNARNLSTPPPVVRKTFPRSVTPDPAKLPPRASQIAALSSTFEPAKNNILSRPLKGASKSTAGSEVGKSTLLPIASNKALPSQNIKVNGNSASSRMETITIHEDAKEGEPEDDEGLPIFPYERLRVNSTDPVPEIDVTRRETYLSSAEFKEKLGMSRDAFFKLPKWKQNKLKMAIRLF